MTNVCTAIIGAIRDILAIAKEVRLTNNQARRLLNRLLALEDPIRLIQNDNSPPPLASLNQTKTLLDKSCDFLKMYKGTSTFARIMKRCQYTTTMVQLNVGLTEAVQSLQLSVAVRRWRREDEEGESEDMSIMKEYLESQSQPMMDQNQVDIMKDIMNALKRLRRDQKPEKGSRREIDVKQLKVQTDARFLGAGGFGVVEIGEWRGSRVAVKMIHSRGTNRESMVHELRREAAVHQDLQYAFIVQLFGACTKGDILGLVMELAPGGSLGEYLLNSSEPLDNALQVAFLYDIARGMSFLHDEGILHRDLKSANVLMFEKSRLKLCDFGLAKVKEESSGLTGVGTAQWMAPELLMSKPGSSSEQSDVYSFGIVCFEVAFREVPFAGIGQLQVATMVMNGNARPTSIAARSPTEILMHHCWQATPCLRPNGFDPVVQRLANLMSVDGDPRESGAGPGNALPPLPVKAPQGVPQNAGQHRSTEQRTWNQRRNTGTTIHEMGHSLGSVSLGNSPSGNTRRPLPGKSGGSASNVVTESSGGHEHILTCPRLHGLDSFVSASWGVLCDRCHKKIPAGITRLRCSRCDFDICLTCVASHMKLLTAAGCSLPAVDCRGRHVLEVHGITRCCNGCDRQFPLEDTTGFTCLRCNHHVCMRCVASCLKKLELDL